MIIYDEMKVKIDFIKDDNSDNSEIKKIEFNTNSIFKTIKNLYNNPEELKVESNSIERSYPHRNIINLMKESLNVDNLSKMGISWNPWF